MRAESEKRWRGYVAGHPEVIGDGTSREKALADAREKLEARGESR